MEKKQGINLEMSQRNKFGSLEQPCSETHGHNNSNEYIERYASKQSIYVHGWCLETRLDNKKAEWLSKHHTAHVTFTQASRATRADADTSLLTFVLILSLKRTAVTGFALVFSFFLPRLIMIISMAFLRLCLH